MKSKKYLFFTMLPVLLFSGCDKEKNSSSEVSVPENIPIINYSADFSDIPDEISVVNELKASDNKFYISAYVDKSYVTEDFWFLDILSDSLSPYKPDINKQYINDFIFKDDKVYICYADDEYNNFVALTDRKGSMINEYKLDFSNVSDMFFDSEGQLCILEVVQPVESDNVINNVHIFDDNGNDKVISLDSVMKLETDDAVVKISGDKSGNIYVLTQKTEPLISSLHIQGKTNLYKVDSSYNVKGKFSYNETENEYISDFILTDDEKLNVIISDESPLKKVYSVDKDTYKVIGEHDIDDISKIYHGISEYDIVYETFSGDGIYGYDFEKEEAILIRQYDENNNQEMDISNYYSSGSDMLISTSSVSDNMIDIYMYDGSEKFTSLDISTINSKGYIDVLYVSDNGEMFCFENSEKIISEDDEYTYVKSYIVSRYDASGKFINSVDITEAVGEENDIVAKSFSVSDIGDICIIYTDMSYSVPQNVLLVVNEKSQTVIKEKISDDYIDFDIISNENETVKIAFTEKDKLIIKDFNSEGEIKENTVIFDYPKISSETVKAEVYRGFSENTVYCKLSEELYKYDISNEKFEPVLNFSKLGITDAHHIVPVNESDIICMGYNEDFEEKFITLKSGE